jgi:hypothetical protein
LLLNVMLISHAILEKVRLQLWMTLCLCQHISDGIE